MAVSCACGHVLAVGARFCGECGRPVAVAAPPPAPVGDAKADAHAFAMRVIPVYTNALANYPEGKRFLDILGRVPGLQLLAPVVVPAGEPCVERVQAQVARMRLAGRLDAVLLVGSDATLPMSRVEDPTGKGDEVLTDNFFGRESTPDETARMSGDLLPEVPVSRLPFDDPAQLRLIVERGPSLAAKWDDGFGVSTSVWEGASNAVAKHIGVPEVPMLSPPHEIAHLTERLARPPARLYFNVHGSDQDTAWFGDGGGMYPRVLAPEAVRVQRGAVVVSEACFGAARFDGETSISEAFLLAGAGAFVGSTIVAWGPPEAPPGLADLVVTGFYDGLDEGLPAARAMLEARRLIVDKYISEDDGLSPQAHNTALSFVHYGLPNARCSVATRPVRKVHEPGPSAAVAKAGSSALDRIRAGMRDGGAGALGQARQRLQGRLSARDFRVLSSGRTSLGELPRVFRDARAVLASLRAAPGTEVLLYRYRTAVAERVSVLVDIPTPFGIISRGVLADPDGRILEKFESKGRARRAAPDR